MRFNFNKFILNQPLGRDEGEGGRVAQGEDVDGRKEPTSTNRRWKGKQQ